MDSQRQFDFTRASKLRRLEQSACSGKVKSVLKALDGFARDAARCVQTMKNIAVSMGCSVDTARRAIRAAQDAGLLHVHGEPTDGRSNMYEINWVAVFELPDGREAMTTSRRKAAVCQGAAETAKCLGPSAVPAPLADCEATPSNMQGDPLQTARGPLANCRGTPGKLLGVSATVTNVKECAISRGGQTEDDDGETLGSILGKRQALCEPRTMPVSTPTLSNPAKPTRSGSWVWTIALKDLEDSAERTRIFKAAIMAGYLADSQIDRVRFRALCIHIRRHNERTKIYNPTGFLVAAIERGDWGNLPDKTVKDAVNLLKYQFTPQQLAEVKQSRMPP